MRKTMGVSSSEGRWEAWHLLQSLEVPRHGPLGVWTGSSCNLLQCRSERDAFDVWWLALSPPDWAMGCRDHESSSVWVCLQGGFMEETDSEQGQNRADGPRQGGAWSRPPRAGKEWTEEEEDFVLPAGLCQLHRGPFLSLGSGLEQSLCRWLSWFSGLWSALRVFHWASWVSSRTQTPHSLWSLRQFLTVSWYIYISYWFCFSGEPRLIQKC